MAKPDFYRILGVSRTASAEEIKESYRKLAFRLHPDRNPTDAGAEERFKEVSLAYAVLGNPQRRAEYDATVRGAMDLDLDFRLDLDDLVKRIFGRLRRRRRDGEDLRYTLTLPFNDAITGTEVRIRVPRQRACERCDGLGVEADRLCVRCEGQGRYEHRDALLVPVPAGVESGRRLRLVGLGNEGVAGGKAGELYVHVEVESHSLLERDGLDVVCEVPVSLSEAALGCEIPVPTPKGIVQLRVPAGTQPGSVLRLAGRGVPPRGDQLVTVRVVVPDDPAPGARQALESLGRAHERRDEPALAEYDRLMAEIESKRGA